MRSATEPIDGGRRLRESHPLSPRVRHVQGAASERAAAEISCLFRDLRRVLRLSLPELASRLGTRINVIAALERGETHRLPPWPETVRVVTAFTGLADIDPRPVLGIIRRQMESGARTVPDARPRLWQLRAAASMLAARAARARMATEEIRTRFAELAEGASGYAPRLGWRLLLVLAALGLSTATYLSQGGWREASLSALPAPLARLMHGIDDYLVWQTAPTRDGLKWIDVEDPRTRRGDRLDSSRR
jgi:transcriptional regulator with XRE-family HTH domain